jgi:hypothetical protein
VSNTHVIGKMFPARTRRAARRFGWALALVPTAVLAQADPQADPPEVPPATAGQLVEIHNCAGGPSLTLAAGDPRALLDETERDALLAEMLVRFPILQRDGFAPPVILMWRKAPQTWLYVSLRPNAFTNDGTLCFTATFVTEGFRLTPALRRKYF